MLEASIEWNCPPWQITEDEDTLLWFFRWQEYRKVIASAQKEKARLNG